MTTLPIIKVARHYTLPHSREERGILRTETLVYEDCGDTAEEWAVNILRDAGCTRHNWGADYITEEPKITNVSEGEEMTATATLLNFTSEQWNRVQNQLEG